MTRALCAEGGENHFRGRDPRAMGGGGKVQAREFLEIVSCSSFFLGEEACLTHPRVRERNGGSSAKKEGIKYSDPLKCILSPYFFPLKLFSF